MRCAWSALLVAACEHTPPFDTRGPDPLGPFTDALPRPLTFNRGDDRQPSVTDGVLVYSRWAGDPSVRETCIAFLPAEGGTIARMLCPRAVGDTFVDTWREPALAPGQDRIAFVWQRTAPVSVFPGQTDVIVVSAEDPAAIERRWPADRVLEDGRATTGAIELSWAGGRLRFLVGLEQVVRVDRPPPGRLTDTTFLSYALMELDPATGTAQIVPGADSAVAYTTAPDGGVWLVHAADSTRLLHLAPGDSTAAPVGVFSRAVTDLANVAGTAVGVFASGGGIEWFDPASGARGEIVLAGPVRRIAAVPGTREFVAEVERSVAPFGDRANLWRVGIP